MSLRYGVFGGSDGRLRSRPVGSWGRMWGHYHLLLAPRCSQLFRRTLEGTAFGQRGNLEGKIWTTMSQTLYTQYAFLTLSEEKKRTLTLNILDDCAGCEGLGASNVAWLYFPNSTFLFPERGHVNVFIASVGGWTLTTACCIFVNICVILLVANKPVSFKKELYLFQYPEAERFHGNMSTNFGKMRLDEH